MQEEQENKQCFNFASAIKLVSWAWQRKKQNNNNSNQAFNFKLNAIISFHVFGTTKRIHTFLVACNCIGVTFSLVSMPYAYISHKLILANWQQQQQQPEIYEMKFSAYQNVCVKIMTFSYVLFYAHRLLKFSVDIAFTYFII